jgi:uncharacterized flavoprotein (TIGR03862 family)
VVGAGPAGLMAAEVLARAGAAATVFDHMPSPARKFLMAGRGGLNLTHSEPFEAFVARYGAAADRLRPILQAFTPDDLRAWSAELGEPCFIGSSGRVFPKSFKASPLLRAWLRRLEEFGARLAVRHRLIELSGDLSVRFETPESELRLRFDAVVLALGGASWPRLGSQGEWGSALLAHGVGLAPWKPANCGFDAPWSEMFRSRFAGAPLKGAVFRFRDRSVRGEAIVTARGLEGGAIYALSAPLREAAAAEGFAVLSIDPRPDVGVAELAARLRRSRAGDTVSQRLRKAANLSPIAIGLMREAHAALPREADELARRIKQIPLRLTGPGPLERAISCAGGVRFDSVDETLMLRALPGVFVCGEMLDFEAPTGGYLLQAAFAAGAAAGRGAARRLGLTKL